MLFAPSSEPPMPWMKRKKSSWSNVSAMPHSALAEMKMA